MIPRDTRREQRRVEQGELDRLGVAGAALDEAGEVVQHLGQPARLLARGDRGPVEIGKDRGISLSAGREAAPVEDRAAHVEQHAPTRGPRLRQPVRSASSIRMPLPTSVAIWRVISGELARADRRPRAAEERPTPAGRPRVQRLASTETGSSACSREAGPRRGRARRLDHPRCGPGAAPRDRRRRASLALLPHHAGRPRRW